MRTLLSTAAIAALLSAPAQAGDVYGKIFGGVGFEQSHEINGEIFGTGIGAGELETDTGYTFGGAIGYQVTDFLGVEAEVAYRSNSIDSGVINGAAFTVNDEDLESLSFIGNVVYTAPEFYNFQPYIGGGAGTARIGFSDGASGANEYVFAYQGFAGVKRQITSNLAAGVEYRYFGADEATFNNSFGAVTTDYESHNVNLVMTVSF